MSTSHFINLPFYQFNVSLTFSFINLLFLKFVILSIVILTHHFVNLMFHPLETTSTHNFID
jgi:hypothetical protein